MGGGCCAFSIVLLFRPTLYTGSESVEIDLDTHALLFGQLFREKKRIEKGKKKHNIAL